MRSAIRRDRICAFSSTEITRCVYFPLERPPTAHFVLRAIGEIHGHTLTAPVLRPSFLGFYLPLAAVLAAQTHWYSWPNESGVILPYWKRFHKGSVSPRRQCAVDMGMCLPRVMEWRRVDV